MIPLEEISNFNKKFSEFDISAGKEINLRINLQERIIS